jgi:hypothetical protein
MPRNINFNGGNQMLNPFIYAPVQRHGIPPEEAFDRMLDAYAHNFSERARGPNYERPSQRIEINAIPVEDARRLFVQYVSHWEDFYRNVSRALQEHMSICTSPSPIMMDMRKSDLRSLFSQGYVVHADRRSGKTQALFDEAEEMARIASCRVAIVSPHKEYVMAEACRRRLNHAVPRQFDALEFLGESDIQNLRGITSDVLVDDWFDLSERSRDMLASTGRVMAVGTMPHGTRIPITAQKQRDEDGYYGRKLGAYNPMAMAFYRRPERE